MIGGIILAGKEGDEFEGLLLGVYEGDRLRYSSKADVGFTSEKHRNSYPASSPRSGRNAPFTKSQSSEEPPGGTPRRLSNPLFPLDEERANAPSDVCFFEIKNSVIIFSC